MSEKKPCAIVRVDAESNVDHHCPNDGVFPYYAERVCEPCARAMLPEDVLPIETIAAMIAEDARRYGHALRDCALVCGQRNLLPRMAALCGHIDHALVDAEYLRDEAIRSR